MPIEWAAARYRAFDPGEGRERALVLAGGGATGIAWETGIILGLRDQGVHLDAADTMIGTSAGSVVASHLRLGAYAEGDLDRITSAPRLTGLGRLGPLDAARFAVATVNPVASSGRALLGRAAVKAHTMAQDAWIELVAGAAVGAPWPQERLLITAVDAQSGTSVVFDAESGVPLERAVAASCTVPGVFPPVEINGRRYIDGGMRTIANVDLARGHTRVVCLAPFPITPRRRTWPAAQLRALGPGVRTLLLTPDRSCRGAMGLNPLDTRRTRATFEAAREQGRARAEAVARVWGQP